MFSRAQTCSCYFLLPHRWQSSLDMTGYCIWHQLYLLHDFRNMPLTFSLGITPTPLWPDSSLCFHQLELDLELLDLLWATAPKSLASDIGIFFKIYHFTSALRLEILTALQAITFPSSYKVGIGFFLPLTTLSLATLHKYAQPLISPTLVQSWE